MSDTRIHRAVSPDGTEIAGTVRGNGPPLVFVHGALGDGELHLAGIAAHLDERYTCHLSSTRGRGASARHPDLSAERRVQDVVAYADSVGEPVGLAGVSGGGALVLGAAGRAASLSSVAAFEPALLELMDEATHARFGDVVARMHQAAAEDRMAEAVRIFYELVANEGELAQLAQFGFFEACARYVPIQLEEIQQVIGSGAPPPTQPAALQEIGIPLLLLHGSETALDWFTQSVRHVAHHVGGAQVRALAGAGHCAPVLEPAAVANELAQFFELEAVQAR